jgi:hypothetical protein
MSLPGKFPPRSLAAALAASLLLAGCGDGGSAVPGKAPVTESAKSASFATPTIARDAPFPSLSSAMLDALTGEVPDLAKHRAAILAAERDAIKGAIDARRAKKSAPARKVSEAKPALVTAWIGEFADLLVPAAMAADAGLLFGVQEYGLGHQMAAMIGAAATDSGAKGNQAKSEPVPGSDGKVLATVKIGAENGVPVGTVETTITIDFLLLEAGSKVSIVGDLCPGPDGKVEFTIKASSKGRAGSGGSAIYDQNLEARVVATVDDNANIANADYEAKQGTRTTGGGRQVYMESSASANAPGDGFGPGGIQLTNGKWIRTSSQATNADVPLANQNLLRAVILGYGALHGARDHWQEGNCIKIQATSPGRVKPGATSNIPVAVNHTKDGSSVRAKVTVALAGGKSITPAVIPHAPGDVTHVAPSDRKSRMKITLTATSRRGKDNLELDLSTGGQAFLAEGGLDDFHGAGTICDIAAPFTIEGSGNVVKFVPTSEKGGNYSYAGNMSGFAVFGNGTYTVKYEGDVPVGIIGTGKGSVKTPMGVHSNVGTEKYTLSPSNAACGS